MTKPSKDIMYDLYITQNLQRSEIAEMFNKSVSTVKDWIKEYGLTNHSNRVKTSKKLRKGCGEITGSYICALRSRNREYNLSAEYLWDLFLKQDRKCVYTGFELVFPPTSRIQDRNKQTASLDRIDSSLGYIVGNVQWIHKDLQFMKSDLSEEKFLHLIKSISDYRSL